MTTKAVCFDLDDTLYPYREYAEAGLRSAAAYLEQQTGHSYEADLFELYFNRGVTVNTFDRLLTREGLPPSYVEPLVEAFHEAADPLDPYPETERVLESLSDSYGLGVITDGREGNSKLSRLGIETYFDSVIVTAPLETSKRDPQVFEQALGELDVRPSKAMYVGDDPRVDFLAPNRLGMRTVRLRRGRYEDIEATEDSATPDYEISHLTELLTHL